MSPEYTERLFAESSHLFRGCRRPVNKNLAGLDGTWLCV